MKLPASIIREIIDIPEGEPSSFTVNTNGRDMWKIEIHKHLRGVKIQDTRDLADLLLDSGDEKAHP